MTTERQKMLLGELYDPSDSELVALRRRARKMLRRFNTRDAQAGESDDEVDADRRAILRELLSAFGEGSWIEPPFQCDYGGNFRLGEKVFLNFNCVVLDVAEISIGDRTLLGPGVQLYAATHPLDYRVRATLLELGKPIRIGSDVWIGGGAIVCPGVTIGDQTAVGAGSVVTRDLPGGVFAAGAPCRIVRQLNDQGPA